MTWQNDNDNHDEKQDDETMVSLVAIVEKWRNEALVLEDKYCTGSKWGDLMAETRALTLWGCIRTLNVLINGGEK